MDISAPMVLFAGIVIGLIAGVLFARALAARGGITDRALDVAATKLVDLAVKHEAATRQAALDAQQSSEKRTLLLRQTLQKVSDSIVTPPNA